MPGLLRGVARTAVIAGTATHVSNNVSRRQANRWSQQQAEQEAPVQQPTLDNDMYTELEKLGQLKNDGIITQQEFDAKKAQILGL
ncbi:SHOCT domain-containing protein [Candidatus Saccharibacteria bacterium]|nr:SHOCT domain-containing protein [Candidatus Saccharibacteria bacterium]